jgi:NADPH:quinone reductase
VAAAALIDLVSYTAGGLPLTAVRKGGMVASTLGAVSGEAFTAAGLTGSNIIAAPVREVLTPLAEQAAAGALMVGVTTVPPPGQAARVSPPSPSARPAARSSSRSATDSSL